MILLKRADALLPTMAAICCDVMDDNSASTQIPTLALCDSWITAG